MNLTELKKSILLVFLVFAKDSVDKYIDEKTILSKFSKRQRKLVIRSIRDLERNEILVKHPEDNRYKLTDEGSKIASTVLTEGAKLWKY